jgi:hypothetical protein
VVRPGGRLVFGVLNAGRLDKTHSVQRRRRRTCPRAEHAERGKRRRSTARGLGSHRQADHSCHRIG